MSKRLLVEPEAEADLAAAFDWYEAHRPGLGDDFMLCVEAALDAIAERPESFPLAHNASRRALLRRFPYLVLFVDLPNVVTVVAVFHTSRDPTSWQTRAR